jgi:hypothetical protein
MVQMKVGSGGGVAEVGVVGSGARLEIDWILVAILGREVGLRADFGAVGVRDDEDGEEE